MIVSYKDYRSIAVFQLAADSPFSYIYFICICPEVLSSCSDFFYDNVFILPMNT